MDISVSRLNQRMAIQVPAELPLGLVFVVGRVEEASDGFTGDSERHFFLREGGHRILCQLGPRTAKHEEFTDGDLIRAGGHLAFELASARYFLQARDVEILEEYRPVSSPLTNIIANAQRRTDIVSVSPSEMPAWVKSLAPAEVQVDWSEDSGDSPDGDSSPDGEEWSDLAASDGVGLADPAVEPALANLSDELIAFLSEAMDGPTDVELTPDLLTNLSGGADGIIGDERAVPPGMDDSSIIANAEMKGETATGSLLNQSDDDLTIPENDRGVRTFDEGGSVHSDDEPDNAHEKIVPWYLVLVVLFLFLTFAGLFILYYFTNFA